MLAHSFPTACVDVFRHEPSPLLDSTGIIPEQQNKRFNLWLVNMHPGGGIQVKLVFDCFFVFLGLSKHLRLLFNLSAIHSVTAVPGYLLVCLISIFNGSFSC
ncbi:hypothetical protein ET875_18385 [Salmonella enterica subsp. enterica serovar Montevideo]|nr:hypothetical protein [Salmonella enterica subsp. enterica serovar Montevideo]